MELICGPYKFGQMSHAFFEVWDIFAFTSDNFI